ncbi:MAG: cytochrome-c peroxidase [Bacteroidota bacterium]|nr:cytochrome-c peroxidase [Bacteroidota bacterium]
MGIQKLLSSLSSKNKRLLCIAGIHFIAIEGILLSFSFIGIQPQNVNVIIDTHFGKLIENIDSLEKNVVENRPITQKQFYYTLSRKNYKYLETVIEYVSPFFAKYYINGPPIRKHDLESGNKVIEPHGFQLLETFFFTDNNSLSKEEIVYEIRLLKETIVQTRKKYKSVTPRTEQYFDMIQMELVRIISLNINGYDCAITKDNIQETTFIFDGILGVLEGIEEVREKGRSLPKIKKLISDSKKYLSLNKGYDSFNRLYFITDYVKPLYSMVQKMRDELQLSSTPVNYAINFSENNLFDKTFFNRYFFSVNISDSTNIVAQTELGKNLFFDPILSGNNKRACASCHKPEFAFSDTINKNFEYNRSGVVKRNTPALLNVMYQKNFFYDGRSLQLEDQVSDVLHAQNEMNSIPAEIVNKLRQSDDYRNLFKKAFNGKADTAITFYGVLKSISEFEKTLLSLNSKFDKYIKGDKKALNQNEINGYNVFAGKALCGSCHFLPLFNGLVPPVYNDNEFEVIGTLKSPNSNELDPDSGRILITKKNIHAFSFKTPGIRNIASTFPYMHNGAYRTLEEVIEFYNKGGGSVSAQKIEHQTLPFDSLQLSTKEKQDIKYFLLSLSDNPYKNITPKKLPKIKDPVLNERKIGGEY